MPDVFAPCEIPTVRRAVNENKTDWIVLWTSSSRGTLHVEASFQLDEYFCHVYCRYNFVTFRLID
jgi:hypothetical protein